MLYRLNLRNQGVTRFIKLKVQSSLKYLITEISENKDLLVLFLYHADHNSKSL